MVDCVKRMDEKSRRIILRGTGDAMGVCLKGLFDGILKDGTKVWARQSAHRYMRIIRMPIGVSLWWAQCRCAGVSMPLGMWYTEVSPPSGLTG